MAKNTETFLIRMRILRRIAFKFEITNPSLAFAVYLPCILLRIVRRKSGANCVYGMAMLKLFVILGNRRKSFGPNPGPWGHFLPRLHLPFADLMPPLPALTNLSEPSSSPPREPPNQPKEKNPSSSSSSLPSSMAFFAIDPRPHVPCDFKMVLHEPDEQPRILSAFLGSCMEAYNDLAIAYFVPEVNKADFVPMAHDLKDYFARVHGVHLAEVLPCAIGDAYVGFLSPVERERFLGQDYQFSDRYVLRLGKHDEGRNASLHNLNRDVWVMLMACPEDAKSNNAIAKVVLGFGLLGYWHDSTNRARVVVKVLLNEDSKIPHGIKVSAGMLPSTRSWTCPVFELKNTEVTRLHVESAFLANRPPFPMSMPLRWLVRDLVVLMTQVVIPLLASSMDRPR